MREPRPWARIGVTLVGLLAAIACIGMCPVMAKAKTPSGQDSATGDGSDSRAGSGKRTETDGILPLAGSDSYDAIMTLLTVTMVGSGCLCVTFARKYRTAGRDEEHDGRAS